MPEGVCDQPDGTNTDNAGHDPERTDPGRPERALNLELDYLTSLIRGYHRPGDAALPAPDGLDWERFLHLCFQHRVTGAVLPRIDRASAGAQMAEQLDGLQGQAGRETTMRLLFLESVLARLETIDCRPLVLKGAPLAVGYYHDPGERYMADLDLLVPRDRIEATCEALAGMGLTRARTQADPQYYRDHHFHWILSNQHGFVVEVHWSLTLPESIYRVDLAGIQERAREVALGGHMMRIPSPADLLLHIVGQCTAGGFGELRRAMDTALLLPRIPDRDELIRLARAQNQATALWALLRLTRRYTGVETDRDLLRELEPSPRTARLLDGLTDEMVFGRGPRAHRAEVQELLHWLCVPSQHLRRRELGRYLAPGPGYWLGIGYSARRGPSVARRLLHRASRLKSLIYLAFVALGTLLRPRPDRLRQLL